VRGCTLCARCNTSQEWTTSAGSPPCNSMTGYCFCLNFRLQGTGGSIPLVLCRISKNGSHLWTHLLPTHLHRQVVCLPPSSATLFASPRHESMLSFVHRSLEAEGQATAAGMGHLEGRGGMEARIRTKTSTGHRRSLLGQKGKPPSRGGKVAGRKRKEEVVPQSPLVPWVSI